MSNENRSRNSNSNSRKKSSSSHRYNSRRSTFEWGFVDEDDSPLPEEPRPVSNRKTAKKKKTAAKSPTSQPTSQSSASASKNPPAASAAKPQPTAPKAAQPGRERTVKKNTPATNPPKGSKTVGSRPDSRRQTQKPPVSAKAPAKPFIENDDDDDDLTLPSYGRTRLDFIEDDGPDEDIEYTPPKRERSTRNAKKGKRADTAKTEPRDDRSYDSGVPRFERPQGDKLARPRKIWDPAIREYVPIEKARPELIPAELRDLAPAKEPPKSAPKKSRPAKKVREERPREETPAPESRKSPEPAERVESPKKQQPTKKSKAAKAKTPEKPQEKVREKPAEKPERKRSERESKQEKRSEKPQKSPVAKTAPAEERPKWATTPRGVISLSKADRIPDVSDIEAPRKTFGKVPLSETTLKAVQLARYLEPTPIQEGVIPRVLTGVDVMGQARTGTGKTAAFLLPLIERIEECEPGNNPVALILVPTRELAVQVRDEARKLSHGRDIRTTACYGGNPIAKQLVRLREGVDIVVGTPGRVLDLMKRGALHFQDLRWIVLDEADRMLDIGFRPDIEKILRQTPRERQTLLFSATLPQTVVRLAERYMREPEILDFSDSGIDVETIEQFYVTIDPERKFDALVYLLHQENPNQAIIFCRTKRGADRVARMLERHFKSMATIHGDLSQSIRDNVMARFRAGTLKILVATDIVGRGIDVSGISHIINYDIPVFCDDYVHRVGRTGRMGREGVAYTFVTIQEGAELTRIEMRINKLLKRADLKGFEAISKPTDSGTEETAESKPVFGKPVRRIRRAL